MSSFRLIVAEKPSVARDIAAALNIRGGGRGQVGQGDVRVTWCVGHLAELDEPASYDPRWKPWRLEHLPMLPEEFRLRPRKGARDQWEVVRELLRDHALGEVINACDAGREGELIFAYVYQLAGCKAPVKRLWISSMTRQAIQQGFDRLRPGPDLRRLEHAARCRAEADWLVGLNATRAMTLRLRAGSGSTLFSLGRVQTPTLALIEQREQAIESFVPEPFWQVKVRFARDSGDGAPAADEGERWDAVWTKVGPGGAQDRLPDEAAARAVLARIAGRTGLVARVERKEKRERPPLLYDLTTLQREANKRFRFSAQKTLDLAQSLYESHKVVTYPRTDSRHIGSDQVPELPRVLESLRLSPFEEAARGVLERWPVALGKRVVDDAEVSDHHAIIPTGVDPRRCSLSRDEKRIFDLVARRFLAVFLPDAVFATALVETRIDADMFLAKGRTMLAPGWRAIDPPKSARDDAKQEEVTLPPVAEGEDAYQVDAKLHEGVTKPPKRYTEATLLGAMERAGEGLEEEELKRAMKRSGLGTPATRAAIIETLISRGYLERDKGALVPTQLGRALLRALPVEALRSPRMTGEWEARLAAMADGEGSRQEFMADVRRFTADLVARIVESELAPDVREVATRAAPSVGEIAVGEVLGTCPRCGAEVRAGGRGWRCSGCPLYIPDTVARRTLSPRMAKQLLASGATATVKGFRNRSGKPFQAALRLDDEGKVVFHFPRPDELGTCPACGAPVRSRGSVYTCDSGRECPFLVPHQLRGRDIAADEVRLLLSQGRTPRLHGFRQHDGAVFKAALVLDPGRGVRFDFVGDRGAEPPPLPPGAFPPAFGQRVDCPLCVSRALPEPGYVIAGKEAWGCSRWKEGCALRVPFAIHGARLPADEAERLFRKKATRYLDDPVGPAGRRMICRVVLALDQTPCWALEPRRTRTRSRR